MTNEELIESLNICAPKKPKSEWGKMQRRIINEAISKLKEGEPTSHFKECYHCGHKSVYWQNDYDFEDFGYEGQGIVQMYTCANCGTEIECSIPITNSESEEK